MRQFMVVLTQLQDCMGGGLDILSWHELRVMMKEHAAAIELGKPLVHPFKGRTNARIICQAQEGCGQPCAAIGCADACV